MHRSAHRNAAASIALVILSEGALAQDSASRAPDASVITPFTTQPTSIASVQPTSTVSPATDVASMPPMLAPPTSLLEQATASHTLPLSTEPEPEKWELSASVYTFLVPDDHDYASPILKADRGWLHLEARYNYEATETGSFFVGYNFSATGEVEVNATPMLGVVFGDTAGVAPGYEVSFAYKHFELYSEGEYLIDTRDTSDSFFYSWSELTYSPAEWIRFGLVAQKTRAYHTDLDIQRGILLGLTWRHFDFTTYLFNVGWDDALLVFAVGWSG